MKITAELQMRLSGISFLDKRWGPQCLILEAQGTFGLHTHSKFPRGSEKGGAQTTVHPVNPPEALELESILAKRCPSTQGRALRRANVGPRPDGARRLARGSPEGGPHAPDLNHPQSRCHSLALLHLPCRPHQSPPALSPHLSSLSSLLINSICLSTPSLC